MGNLLDYSKNYYSQNGEDGIIERIFSIIGLNNGSCCEFGAWDGIHLSNTRELIQNGWSAISIEGDPQRYKSLLNTYKDNPNVHCFNRYVDNDRNKLSSIMAECNYDNCDFLSIDIDGLDYEILDGLDIRPMVVCIEVNGVHSPDSDKMIERDIAKNNVGQPLKTMTMIAEKKGYKLVCYTSNAFYVRDDLAARYRIKTLTPRQAYYDYLKTRTKPDRTYLYLSNKGLVNPYYKFNNPYINLKDLKLNLLQIFYYSFIIFAGQLYGKIKG